MAPFSRLQALILFSLVAYRMISDPGRILQVITAIDVPHSFTRSPGCTGGSLIMRVTCWPCGCCVLADAVN